MGRGVNLEENFLSRHSFVDIPRAALVLGVKVEEVLQAIRRGELICRRFTKGKRYILKSHLKVYYEQRLQGRVNSGVEQL